MPINKLFSFFIRLNFAFFILIFLGISYVTHLFTFIFPESWSENPVINDMSESSMPFLTIIGIPWIETVLFQSLIIGGICAFVKRPRYNFYLSIGLSAVLFGLSHSFNIYYMIWTTSVGIIIGFAYYIARYKTNWPFLPVFIIHALWNSIGFIGDFIYQ